MLNYMLEERKDIKWMDKYHKTRCGSVMWESGYSIKDAVDLWMYESVIGHLYSIIDEKMKEMKACDEEGVWHVLYLYSGEKSILVGDDKEISQYGRIYKIRTRAYNVYSKIGHGMDGFWTRRSSGDGGYGDEENYFTIGCWDRIMYDIKIETVYKMNDLSKCGFDKFEWWKDRPYGVTEELTCLGDWIFLSFGEQTRFVDEAAIKRAVANRKTDMSRVVRSTDLWWDEDEDIGDMGKKWSFGPATATIAPAVTTITIGGSERGIVYDDKCKFLVPRT